MKCRRSGYNGSTLSEFSVLLAFLAQPSALWNEGFVGGE
jgi:hypothetical protein